MLVRKSTRTLRRLEIDGTVLTGLLLVNCINNYFANAVLTIPRVLTPPVVYPFLTRPVLNSCFFYPTTSGEVGKVIMNLKNKGSKIHDIPTLLIKENKDIFAHQIATGYNSSLLGLFHTARVMPASALILRHTYVKGFFSHGAGPRKLIAIVSNGAFRTA